MAIWNSGLRFATDDDVADVEPSIKTWWPQYDAGGNQLRDWDVQHQRAMSEIDGSLRASKSTPEQFELGKVGVRTREQLRECAACFFVHFAAIAADTQGSGDDFFARKAAYYDKRAHDLLRRVAVMIDYDANNDGTISEDEKSRPFAQMFIRG